MPRGQQLVEFAAEDALAFHTHPASSATHALAARHSCPHARLVQSSDAAFWWTRGNGV